MARLTHNNRQLPAGHVRMYGRGWCEGCAKRIRLGQPGPAGPPRGCPDTCQVCGRAMVPREAKRKPRNHVRHRSNGLCHGCSSRLVRGKDGPAKPHKRKHRKLEIDEQAVERAVRAHWDSPKLNYLERRAAIDYLLSCANRYSSEEIARRIGTTARCVDRRRATLKAALKEAA
jgi:hypothetical protein